MTERLEEMLFSVVIIDGHYSIEDQYGQDSLTYNGLSWEEATELIRLGFNQGFEAVIWRLEDE